MREDDPLLRPYHLRRLRLANRIVSTSHEPAYSEDGLPKGRYRRYHVEKARGGVGLTMIGGSAVVSRDSPPAFGNLQLHRDEIVPWLRELTDAVHEHGTAVMCQVTHLGRRSSNFTGDWLPLVHPSPQREPAHRSVPKIAEPWDLERILADYVSAAQRCAAAGLDGIELQSYGHLLDSFLSPRTNPDGGTLDERMAFPRRVITAVRAAVGPEFIMGIRMALDESCAGGLPLAEGLAAAHCYLADGIDFLSTIKGTIDNDAALARVIPPMGEPSAPFLEFTAAVKRELGIPVMHAARIADVATARHAVAEGMLDLVGMTRAHLADPHLVAKIRSGQEDRIRPCVGASYCLDAIYSDGAAKCVHNPATGREGTLPHELSPIHGAPRRIVVVGAGPAGLEAARVLGGRGHEVVLFEAGQDPGGQLLLAARSPRRRDLLGIVDWRVREAKQAGVRLRFGVLAEPEDIRAERPDMVILATGGSPAREFLGEGGELIEDSWDVLSGGAQGTGDVLVYDEHGANQALDAAEVLANAGAHVRYATPERTLAPDVGAMIAPGYLKVFAEHGVRTTLAERLVGVRRADGRLRARLRSEYAEQEHEITVDRVVTERGTLPNDELYFALLPESSNLGEIDHTALLAGREQRVVANPAGEFALFRIGDAVTSRNIHAAVLDALRLCSAIGPREAQKGAPAQ
ncbi:FAD-dependent oxidoreductase [Sciscionella sediminilitoris]|uniref:oxidoreductase n=1 Tax=Sciscionella sediminilitoris TaxID=1445613 RepID=UPI00055E46A4|nr:FAD-dependent oxidoreductase [Sciscionella sp. SE31]